MSSTAEAPPRSAAHNACKLCSPLGASLVFKGIRGCLPFLHGSQGCATYIRRYLISHFREPVDIASSSFSEDDAIFGGARNFALGVDNVIRQYRPEVIGIATTCLSETIGENMIGMIRAYQEKQTPGDPPLVHVSTPAYTGTHSEGFHATVKAVVERFTPSEASPEPVEKSSSRLNLLPGMVSCADLRHLRELLSDYGFESTVLPDYSETLEGESWDAYHRIPSGGTPLEEIATMHRASATLELGHSLIEQSTTAAAVLENRHQIPRHSLGFPLGIRLTDHFCTTLSILSGRTMPAHLRSLRGRLVDSYVDAHKYLAGQTAAIIGDPDLVVALAAFLSEVGVRPIICATGSKLKHWESLLASEIEGGAADVEILKGADHAGFATRIRERKPTLLVGSSKLYPTSRENQIPLLRVGFPIHDRFGAQRQLSLGYAGTQALFDRLVNTVLENRQDTSVTGYSYL